MKVIDLYVMLSKGEQPKKFKYRDEWYAYSIDDYDFRTLKQEYRNADVPTYQYLMEIIDASNLNDEVEVIEDNKEIAGKKHAENNVNFEALINELRYCRELLKVEKKDKKLPKIEYIYKVDDEKQNANNEKFKDFINDVTDKLNEVLNEK